MVWRKEIKVNDIVEENEEDVLGLVRRVLKAGRSVSPQLCLKLEGEVFNDIGFVKELLRSNTNLLGVLPDKFRDDRSIVKMVMALDHGSFAYASDSCRNDPKMILEFANWHAKLWGSGESQSRIRARWLEGKIKNTHEFWGWLANELGSVIEAFYPYLGDGLRRERHIVERMVEDGNFKYLDKDFRSDKKIVAMVLNTQVYGSKVFVPGVLDYVSVEIREICERSSDNPLVALQDAILAEEAIQMKVGLSKQMSIAANRQLTWKV